MGLNLFSIFDPSTRGGLSLNWLALFVVILVFPYQKFWRGSRWCKIIRVVAFTVLKELNPLLQSSKKKFLLMFLSLFFFLLVRNSIRLLPYIFTPARHMAITLSLALPLWLGFYLYGWVLNTRWMLAHLVPQGTPWVLLPFMVLVESIRRLIRPGTLSVRLAANIVAGHILLALIRGASRILGVGLFYSIVVLQILLILLETAVAAIQAYVFVVLRVLYLREI